MFFTMLSLINAGDEVIYPDPGFPIYESMVGFLGGVKRPILLREERDFRFDIAELAEKISPKTKMLIINSPQNPTGGVLGADDLDAIAMLEQQDGQFYEPAGCDNCRGTGYRGRKAVIEIMEMDDEMRELFISKSRITAIKQKARESGTVFLRRAALQEVFNGVTTLREANRVTFVEMDS